MLAKLSVWFPAADCCGCADCGKGNGILIVRASAQQRRTDELGEGDPVGSDALEVESLTAKGKVVA